MRQLGPITCALFILSCLLVRPADALSLVVLEEDRWTPIELKSQIVTTEIEGPRATTTIEQTFHNPNSRDLEGTFVFPLPENAQIGEFTMWINGEETKAEVMKREEARAIYTRIVRQTKDPGLLEYIDERTISMRLFPIPAKDDMPIRLEIIQELESAGGFFAYELGGDRSGSFPKPTESDIVIRVDWPRAMGQVFSPTHAFDVDYSKERTRAELSLESEQWDMERLSVFIASASEGIGIYPTLYRERGAEEGTFMLLIDPPHAEKSKVIPKTISFVLDTSGSMDEEGKLEKAVAALSQCIGGLGSDDYFNIITFSSTVKSWRGEPIQASKDNKKEAKKFLKELSAVGGTNIEGALKRALASSQNEETELHQIIFLTDGLPTIGAKSDAQLMEVVAKENKDGLRLFTVGVGYDVNARLLDRFAEDTRALADYIHPEEDVELAVSRFFEAFSSPAMTGLELEIEGVKTTDIYPTELPDLFRGRSLTVFGRYSGDGDVKIRLTGNTSKEEEEFIAEADFPKRTSDATSSIEAIWAKRKVGYLLEEIRDNGESKEVKEEIIALAEEFSLITPYTSFLAWDETEMRQQRLANSERRLRMHLSGGGPTVDNVPDVIITDRRMERAASPPSTSRAYTFTEAFSLSDYASFDEDLSTIQFMSEENGEHSKPAARIQAKTGQTAVLANEMIQAQRSAENVGSRAAHKLIQRRRVADRTFEQVEGRWIDQSSVPNGSEQIEVEYLSDAYFYLLDAFSGLKDAILLGDQVSVVIKGRMIVIGPEGVSKESDLKKALDMKQ